MNFNKKVLTNRSQNLRKNMTKEERHLWYDFLKNLPIVVHRQKVIGPYIVDFYVAAKKIVIEIDGSQHYEGDAIKKDEKRDAFLRELGIKVLRYSNLEINKNFNYVCQDRWNHIDTSSVTS